VKRSLGILACLLLTGLAGAQGSVIEGGKSETGTSGSAGTGQKVVKPGFCGGNGDVKAENEDESGGTATITPGKGASDETDSSVSTTSQFKGTISGIESGDTVKLGHSANATVTGEGGTVDIRASSSVTVINTGSGSAITVTLPGGTTATVPGGSSTTFSTGA
jgi:hypothetical protein